MEHRVHDEYLELLFHLRERHRVDLDSLRAHLPEVQTAVLDEMAANALVEMRGEDIALTETGVETAEKIVRRHRLAERLLVDVLHMRPSEVEESACEFEHLVADEITDSICTLLGHPRTCPHGSPIPRGACCEDADQDCLSAVVALKEVPIGVWFRIAYITSVSDERQHHLAHLGVAPGQLVRVHQKRPSFILILENSRVAMEPGIAGDIYVWKKTYGTGKKNGGEKRRGLLWWRRPTADSSAG
jgi:DtxR family Mn-dependent transcriptional regulator